MFVVRICFGFYNWIRIDLAIGLHVYFEAGFIKIDIWRRRRALSCGEPDLKEVLYVLYCGIATLGVHGPESAEHTSGSMRA